MLLTLFSQFTKTKFKFEKKNLVLKSKRPNSDAKNKNSDEPSGKKVILDQIKPTPNRDNKITGAQVSVLGPLFAICVVYFRKIPDSGALTEVFGQNAFSKFLLPSQTLSDHGLLSLTTSCKTETIMLLTAD